MKAIKLFNYVLVFILLSLMLSSSTASAVEIDQTRPNVIFREVTQVFSNSLIKGNNSDSPVELIVNSAIFGGVRTVVRGDPTVTHNSENITIEGNVNAVRSSRTLSLVSGFQKDSYIPGLPVNERFVHRSRDLSDSGVVSFELNTTLELRQNFTELDSNENITKVTRDDLTGFIHRFGALRIVTINDTNGDPLATVIGFVINIKIAIFQTSSQTLIGAHETTIEGIGNIFPTDVLTFLSDSSYVQQIGGNPIGLAQLQGDNRISWYYHGFNDTLGLDIYVAQYNMARHSRSILFTPPPSSNSLSLNSVSLETEAFLTDLEAEHDFEVEDTSVESFDTQVVDRAVEQDAIDIPTTSNPGTSPNSETPDDGSSESASLDLTPSFIMVGQIVALTIIGTAFFRRYR